MQRVPPRLELGIVEDDRGRRDHELLRGQGIPIDIDDPDRCNGRELVVELGTVSHDHDDGGVGLDQLRRRFTRLARADRRQPLAIALEIVVPHPHPFLQ